MADPYSVGNLQSGYEYYSAENRYLIGPQPSPEDFADLKSNQEVVAVINLRSLRENKRLKFDAAESAKASDVGYYEIPLMRRGAPQTAALTEISKILKKHDDGKILLHCASGNRAAGWYAVLKATQKKMTTDEAMAFANKVGLQNRKLNRQLRTYFEKNGITEMSIPDESIPAEDVDDGEPESDPV